LHNSILKMTFLSKLYQLGGQKFLGIQYNLLKVILWVLGKRIFFSRIYTNKIFEKEIVEQDKIV